MGVLNPNRQADSSIQDSYAMVWNRFECDGHGKGVTRGSHREIQERERIDLCRTTPRRYWFTSKLLTIKYLDFNSINLCFSVDVAGTYLIVTTTRATCRTTASDVLIAKFARRVIAL